MGQRGGEIGVVGKRPLQPFVERRESGGGRLVRDN
jgi:hypothetical protein